MMPEMTDIEQDAATARIVADVLGIDPHDLRKGPRNDAECRMWTATDKALWFARMRLERVSETRQLSRMERALCNESKCDLIRECCAEDGPDIESADDLAVGILAGAFEVALEYELRGTAS